jgi:hypothetical protein
VLSRDSIDEHLAGHIASSTRAKIPCALLVPAGVVVVEAGARTRTAARRPPISAASAAARPAERELRR